jgi:hypothetical protein
MGEFKAPVRSTLAMSRICCVCPATIVQAWVAEEVPADKETFSDIALPACKVHLVNPATGKVLENDDE